MNLRAAAIHTISLHYPAILGHTEDVQAYVVTGGQDILGILPDVGLEGDELTRATALLLSDGRDLIDDFPLVSVADQVSLDALWSTVSEGIGVLWSDDPSEAPEGWPDEGGGVQPYYAFVARAYIVRAIKTVYSALMEPLADEQLAYVTEGSSAVYDKLVAAGVSDEDADRLAVLMDVEADVFPFDLGLSGILNGGEGESSGGGGPEGRALRVSADDQVCSLDTGLSGHEDANGHILPTTVVVKFNVPSLSNSLALFGRGGDGFPLVFATVLNSGGMTIFIRDSSSRIQIPVPAGALRAGASNTAIFRTEGTVDGGFNNGKRLWSLRLNGTLFSHGSVSGNSTDSLAARLGIGSDDGGVGGISNLHHVGIARNRATDAHCEAIESASTPAAFTAAMQAVAGDAAALPVTSADDVSVGVINTGTGANAVCTGMTNEANLVEIPAHSPAA